MPPFDESQDAADTELDQHSTGEAWRPEYRGLATSTLYYVPLVAMSDHFLQRIHVIAICSDVFPIRYQPRDGNFVRRLSIVDKSLLGTPEIKVLIIRSEKSALPACRRGDVILLNRFLVFSDKTLDLRSRSQGLKHKYLLSGDVSAWKIITTENNLQEGNQCTEQRVETSAWPIDYTHEELEYAMHVRTWWKSQDASISGRKAIPY